MEILRTTLTQHVFERSNNPHQQVEESFPIHDDDPEENDYMKNAGTNRSPTDVPFLVLHGIVTFLLMFFFSYCVVYGDIERITFGYDDCGNVCGKINDFDIDDAETCKALDMTAKPYLRTDSNHRRTCVVQCEKGELEFGHHCIQSVDFNEENVNFDVFDQAAKDLNTCSKEIVGLVFFALGLTFCIYLLLRYFTTLFVWATMVIIMLLCVAFTGTFWYITQKSEGFTIQAIVSTLFTFIVILVILIMRKRINFIIRLLKEAGKSISAFPWIVFEPLLTCTCLLAVWMGCIFFAMWIESAGTAIETYGRVKFQKNGFINFTRWYNLFVMLWMIQFIYGCQHMLIAGAVSAWYFIRNKSKLSSPVYNSARNMIRYHLGTISFGSLIIVLIQIIRFLLRSFRRRICILKCISCMCCIHGYIDSCLSYLEGGLTYLTKNAYIVTSIRGTTFLESGRKAFNLLVNNVFNVFAINSIADFVLLLSKAIIIAGTVGLSIFIFQDKTNVKYISTPVILVGIISVIIAHCFISVYEMAIDTIFICFCEDCEVNDGVTRPYFMSQKLMMFVQDVKNTFDTATTVSQTAVIVQN